MLEDGDGTMAAVGGILIALGVLISLGITLWNRVFRMGRTGQSVGKSAMSLKLIDDKNGQPIGAGMCFVREIVAGLANQIFYLSWLWMLWDTDKQTLADKAVHSTVVCCRSRPRRAGARQAGESQVNPGTLRSTQNARIAQNRA